MSCEKHTSSSGDDCVEGSPGGRPFDVSATAWLIGEGVRYLNTAGKEGELAYQRVVELLRGCNRDVLETVAGLFEGIESGDAPLRWSLLYVLGDAGDGRAGEFLVRTALKPLPEAKPEEGCEGARDAEMLVCTMAIQALRRIAERDPEASDQLLKIVSERPARPLLIEAVRAAIELGLREEAQGILPPDEQWILDIRRAEPAEVYADPERKDGKERGFTPPKTGPQYTAPRAVCCGRKEK